MRALFFTAFFTKTIAAIARKISLAVSSLAYCSHTEKSSSLIILNQQYSMYITFFMSFCKINSRMLQCIRIRMRACCI